MTSKFTESRRDLILDLLAAGSSRQHASKVVGIDRLTLRKWLRRGERAPAESQYRAFYLAVLKAEATPRLVALRAEADRRESDPDVALTFLEARGEFRLPPEPDIVRRLLNVD